MIILHSKKVIFLETPKTGSMSLAEAVKRQLLTKDDRVFGQHTTIEKALRDNVITEEQADEYSIYAFIRNPWDRTTSAFNHLYGENENKRIFASNQLKDHSFLGNGILSRPQYEMYSQEFGTELLLFEDYDNEINRVVNKHWGFNLVTQSINVRRTVENYIPPSIFDYQTRKFIKAKYRKDFNLWNNTKLKQEQRV